MRNEVHKNGFREWVFHVNNQATLLEDNKEEVE